MNRDSLHGGGRNSRQIVVIRRSRSHASRLLEMRMEFKATLELDGKTATGITVPDTVIAALGAGKRPLVLVTINGRSFTTTIASMRGDFKIPVSAENGKLVGVAAGDSIRVSVEVAATPTELDVPGDLVRALASQPAAAKFFEGLTASQKKGFIVPIEEAKSDETRRRRVDKAITALKAKQKRP